MKTDDHFSFETVWLFINLKSPEKKFYYLSKKNKMVKSELIDSLFEQPSTDFFEHLSLRGNERIIFSGNFGIGKTRFLKEWFFTDKNRLSNAYENYNVFHLFPVNYSVAQSEDIFGFIKYDILLEMLRKGLVVEEIDLSYIQTFPFFVKENLFQIGATLLQMVPKVGKELVENSEKIKKLIDKYLSYHNEKSISSNTASQFLEYIGKIEKKEGSIYEQDVITKLITQELGKFKSDSEKENILIIDDLDRIDPEHIFRILNVFAAHFDLPNSGYNNKFNFDKVVLVCDIENVRQIFKSKFGSKVDFNGYIDKFYSQRIFEFNPYQNILGTVHNFVFEKLNSYPNRSKSQSFLSTLRNSVLTNLLDHLIVNKQIDLRNILKLSNGSLSLDFGFTIHTIHVENNNELLNIVWTLKILTYLKGDYLSLIDSLDKSENWEYWIKQDLIERHCYNLLYLLLINKHREGNGNYEYILGTNKYELILKQGHLAGKISYKRNDAFGSVKIQIDDFNLLKNLLKEVIRLLHSQNIL